MTFQTMCSKSSKRHTASRKYSSNLPTGFWIHSQILENQESSAKGRVPQQYLLHLTLSTFKAQQKPSNISCKFFIRTTDEVGNGGEINP